MADLRDRGQIILIAAFALAVTFVALALIVNSAIFTENLASRGEVTGGSEALDTRYMVEQGVGETLDASNRETTYPDIRNRVQNGTVNVTEQVERQQVGSGVLLNVSYTKGTDTEGSRINQTASRSTFEAGSGDDYLVVEDVTRVPGHNGTRAFRMNVTTAGLADNNESAFKIKANDSSVTGPTDRWRTEIWDSAGNDTVHVRTYRNISNDDDHEQCKTDVPGQFVRIDVTRGTVNGEPCDALRRAPNGDQYTFANGAGSPYDIYFQNADNATGNFSMITTATTTDIPLLSLDDYQKALYDVTVEFTYDRADFHYETQIRVAPGEPDA